MNLAELLPLTLAVTLGAMFLLWLVSLPLRNASIVDAFWGPGFALIALVAYALGDGYAGRRLLLTAMACVWGLRLGLYILWRNWGRGEDFRYREMREGRGEGFWWTSLFTVFGLQGVLMWLISLPLQVAQTSALPDRLTWLDFVGLAFWSVGIFFEAVGDWQMARFKSDPRNRGRVMDRGLWRYTRHPNYFGDAMVWWGHYVVAAATAAGVWMIASPVLMNWLVVRVSGVSLLEKTLERRPGYREYIARTSAFLPRPPRGTAEERPR